MFEIIELRHGVPRVDANGNPFLATEVTYQSEWGPALMVLRDSDYHSPHFIEGEAGRWVQRELRNYSCRADACDYQEQVT